MLSCLRASRVCSIHIFGISFVVLLYVLTMTIAGAGRSETVVQLKLYAIYLSLERSLSALSLVHESRLLDWFCLNPI